MNSARYYHSISQNAVCVRLTKGCLNWVLCNAYRIQDLFETLQGIDCVDRIIILCNSYVDDTAEIIERLSQINPKKLVIVGCRNASININVRWLKLENCSNCNVNNNGRTIVIWNSQAIDITQSYHANLKISILKSSYVLDGITDDVDYKLVERKNDICDAFANILPSDLCKLIATAACGGKFVDTL
jgi:hypothetical protein